MKHLILFLSLAAAVACVPLSVDHFQSQARLEEGIARKIAAENAVRAAVAGNGQAGGPGAPLPDSIASARIALARDARTDFQQATARLASAPPADRISLLLNAGQKSLYAGREADAGLVTAIRDAGRQLCAAPDALAPVRDCDLIEVLPAMTALQQKRDIVFDIGIDYALRRRSGDDTIRPAELGQLVDALSDMEAGAAILVAASTGRRADIRDLVLTWQRDFWCSAAAGMGLMAKTVSGDAKEIGREAKNLALEPHSASTQASPELLAVLARTGMAPAQLRGDYTEYTRLVAQTYGLPQDLTTDQTFRKHARLCG